MCRALGLTRVHDGSDLVTGPLQILDASRVAAAHVARTPRIGVDYAGAHAALPWRFLVVGSRAVSGTRARTGVA